MVRTKVFVGNLSFNTKENELAKEFEVAGKVISANIITRGPRSLGYGFVELDSEADAENAVRLLNKKEIDGRAINVEVAKPREEGAEGENADQGANGAQRGGARGGRGGARGGAPRGARGTGGNFRGGRGGGRARRRSASDDEGEGEQQQGQQQEQGEGRRGRGGFRGGRGRGGPRRGREDRGDDTRTPSTTTLFVANLPFSFDDEAFGKVLKDNGLAFKGAHIVKRKTGQSKGFGFAEFDNEKDQQAALGVLNGKQIEGRELSVKVALTENPNQGEVKAENVVVANTDAPAENKA